MASSVKVVMKPHQIHPGKERQVEHARQLVQQGLNRGMRLQEAPKIVPLPPDEVGKESQEQEPQPEPQKPAPKTPKKPAPTKNEVVTETQAVKESPLITSTTPVIAIGSQYKTVGGDKIVTVVGGAWNRGFLGENGFILLADAKLLKKGNTQVTAIDYDAFMKKFEKVP
jgi:outer membrane biosynthesis protein TonB